MGEHCRTTVLLLFTVLKVAENDGGRCDVELLRLTLFTVLKVANIGVER